MKYSRASFMGLLGFAVVLGLAGCATARQQQAATIGGIQGAAAGAAVGAANGDTLGGAIVGGIIGATSAAIMNQSQAATQPLRTQPLRMQPLRMQPLRMQSDETRAKK